MNSSIKTLVVAVLAVTAVVIGCSCGLESKERAPDDHVRIYRLRVFDRSPPIEQEERSLQIDFINSNLSGNIQTGGFAGQGGTSSGTVGISGGSFVNVPGYVDTMESYSTNQNFLFVPPPLPPLPPSAPFVPLPPAPTGTGGTSGVSTLPPFETYTFSNLQDSVGLGGFNPIAPSNPGGLVSQQDLVLNAFPSFPNSGGLP